MNEDVLAKIFAKNKAKYSGWTWELKEEEKNKEEEQKEEENQKLPAEAGKKGDPELSQEEQLKLVLDEVEALREENKRLKQNNSELETKKVDIFERLKEVSLGRSTINVEELNKQVQEETKGPKKIEPDYFTKELNFFE